MHALVWRLVVAVIVLVVVPFAHAEDAKGAKSLAGRLAGYKFAGLALNPDAGGYTLNLYTPRQHEQNLAKLRETGGGPAASRMRTNESFHTIVSVGDDYVELASATDEKRVSLIALAYIRRVNLPRADMEVEGK